MQGAIDIEIVWFKRDLRIRDHLPEEEQKELRRGQKKVNRIFNKARLRDWMHEDNEQSGRTRVIGVQGRKTPGA